MFQNFMLFVLQEASSCLNDVKDREFVQSDGSTLDEALAISFLQYFVHAHVYVPPVNSAADPRRTRGFHPVLNCNEVKDPCFPTDFDFYFDMESQEGKDAHANMEAIIRQKVNFVINNGSEKMKKRRKKCRVDGCTKNAKSNGMCINHNKEATSSS